MGHKLDGSFALPARERVETREEILIREAGQPPAENAFQDSETGSETQRHRKKGP